MVACCLSSVPNKYKRSQCGNFRTTSSCQDGKKWTVWGIFHMNMQPLLHYYFIFWGGLILISKLSEHCRHYSVGKLWVLYRYKQDFVYTEHWAVHSQNRRLCRGMLSCMVVWLAGGEESLSPSFSPSSIQPSHIISRQQFVRSWC